MSVTDPDFFLQQAADYLDQGKVIAFPTDTVYGLGVALNYPNAEEKIYDLKHRDRGKSLVMYVNTIEDIEKFSGCTLSTHALKLSQKFLPGPLTLLVDHKNPRFHQEKLGFRILSIPIVNKLIDLAGPLLGTSANISNFPPAITSNEVIEDFFQEDICVIPGFCSYGLESTVVSADPLKVYREGIVPHQVIEDAVGEKIDACLHTHHIFSQHMQIYTVKDEDALKIFLERNSRFQGVICNNPKPCDFYPTLRQAFRSVEPVAVFIYDQETSAYPELIPYLIPYSYTYTS
ncbi:L-threonylcarbamoyladenylate synthase [Chlamydia buteonis]|uniref:L-threonylcarbamoyladenylate synthase n=1 Tax=Chlamydia buteonis TaxID=2494525 RepID=A0ABX8LAC9_9CHLA|nr:L-threonylcarbamoyladenylate synthase [Chlamydia buteonis]QXE27505.1 L-threonylcarbamoyladenylate synthase [Chlamydia buteonis]QXE28352.1 L-threonylcarbamoyladenylate synthase [Chlamydia buteonis]